MLCRIYSNSGLAKYSLKTIEKRLNELRHYYEIQFNLLCAIRSKRRHLKLNINNDQGGYNSAGDQKKVAFGQLFMDTMLSSNITPTVSSGGVSSVVAAATSAVSTVANTANGT